MTLAAEKQSGRAGETAAVADHAHALVHELSKRLDAIWRYDQYIANAEDKQELRAFWRKVKQQDQQIVDELRKLVKAEADCGCF